MTKCRIAVASPFLDRRHGTERRVVEALSRLAQEYRYDIHIYSQRISDLANVEHYTARNTQEQTGMQQSQSAGTIWWHRIPDIPGPYLLKYAWWFIANQLWRWWDCQVRGLAYDLVYSPGINCLDADVITVHIVFTEFYRQIQTKLRLLNTPVRAWPLVLHRTLYYRLIIFLEQIIYRHKARVLVAISQQVAQQVAHFHGPRDPFPILYHGIDRHQFAPEVRAQLRSEARRSLGLPEDACVVLLIGNDWQNKGLACLLEAVGRVEDPRLLVIVAGKDEQRPFDHVIAQQHVRDRVLFQPPRPDVEFYYAAADIYAGPSLEDAFALPPAEAMACGLPVIVSSRAGASEMITDGVDGLILNDPTNAAELAGLIQRLSSDPALRQQLGERAVKTAHQYTWERNAAKLHMIFQLALLRKARAKAAVP